MNDSMARPQAGTPGPKRWQKALDIVALSWPGVCPGLGSCCHKDSQLLITDILFLPGPISEAQARLRYRCFPPPIPGTEAGRPSTPKGLGRFVAQLTGPGPGLSARLSRGSGTGYCLTLGGTLQPGKNLFRALAGCHS